MFHVIKRCQILVPSVLTRTVPPAMTRLEPVAVTARRSPTLRRDFALNFSQCQRHCRANSSHSVQTRRYSEQCSKEDGDAAAVTGETTEIDRRNEGSVMVQAKLSHWGSILWSHSIYICFHLVWLSFICCLQLPGLAGTEGTECVRGRWSEWRGNCHWSSNLTVRLLDPYD